MTEHQARARLEFLAPRLLDRLDTIASIRARVIGSPTLASRESHAGWVALLKVSLEHEGDLWIGFCANPFFSDGPAVLVAWLSTLGEVDRFGCAIDDGSDGWLEMVADLFARREVMQA